MSSECSRSQVITTLRLLVVEDDPMFNMMYTTFLQSKGAVVVSCDSLAVAMQQILSMNTCLDAIILDNQLGDGEGIELLTTIKKRYGELAVVMVSGNDDANFFLQAYQSGIHDYMVKPINLDLLWLKISSAVEQFRLKVLTNKQNKALEQWVDEEQTQQRLAKHLFDRMFHDINQPHASIFAWLKPYSVFSGDAILRCQATDGSWYFLLSDAMGHGLAPAITLMPLLTTFHAMAEKAIPLSNIVFEMNETLHRILPDDRFIAAVLVRLDPWQHTLEVWNGGIPDVLLLDKEGLLITSAPSRHMALGVLARHQLSVQLQQFSLTDLNVHYFLLHSDGLTETVLAAERQLHTEELPRLIHHQSETPLQEIQHLFKEVPEQDDVSLCFVKCAKLITDMDAAIQSSHQPIGAFNVSFTLRGHSLVNVDIPTKIVELLKSHNLPMIFVQRVFTVLTELYVNALEHGVLKLESGLKSEPDGFIRYYEEKEQRIAALTAEDCIELHMHWLAEPQQLHLHIADSGEGFTCGKQSIDQEQSLHGRGFTLIEQLTDYFEITPPGSNFRLVMNLVQ